MSPDKKIKRKLTMNCVVCYDPIPYKRAVKGATTCDPHLKDCKKILRQRNKAKKLLNRKDKYKADFVAFLKKYDYGQGNYFIDSVEGLIDLLKHYINYNFNALWELLRCAGYHLHNNWKIPCKAYLKKYYPEICKLIKDLN